MRFRSLLATTLLAGLVLPLLVVHAQQSVGRDVTMQLTPKQTSVAAGEQVQVDFFVNNPSKRPLTSVEVLLSYDPTALRGISVAYATDTPFEMNLLSAGESEFNATAGQVHLSRATLKDTSLLSDTKYPFATMTFEATGSGTPTIDFVKTLNGLDRVTANTTVEGISTNIVNTTALTPVTISVSGTRGSASTTSSGTTVSNIFGSSNTNTNTSATNVNTNTSVIQVATNTNVNLNSNFASLSNLNSNIFSGVTTGSASNMNSNRAPAQTLDAPRDVAIKKDGKKISLYWSNDDIASATYIYYSTSPDAFKARKRVNYPETSFVFNSMATKGMHYFVLTSVDASGRESAYTPMFVVDATKNAIYYENDSYLNKIVDRGSLGTFTVTTQGISDKARSSLSLVPTMPENGPAEMLLLLLLASLGGAAFLSTRRKQTSL